MPESAEKKVTFALPNKSQKPYCLIRIVRCVFGVEHAIHKQTMAFIMLKVYLRQYPSGPTTVKIKTHYRTNEVLQENASVFS